MLKIKRFLGFTDGIKEPRKTKVENELSRCYSYKGNIYNAVEFLCTKLLDGCYLEKEENYTKLKRNGERTKPKTLYMFFDKDVRRYFELNKTQYDFVCYLIENGLNTEEKILAYDKADTERFEALQKAEEEEKARQEEEKQRREEEKEKFKSWMFSESENIPQFQKDIIDSIFLAIYGTENSWNYSLAVCINNYNNPLCKEEVISRLHNDNKASIKIFECLTGLKLPKGYKERVAYLEGLTVSDFKEAVDYKPRKKAERTEEKEVQKEEFYTLMYDNSWKKVIAEPITKYGMDMFIHFENDVWKISHAEVGMSLASGKTKTECMQKLKELVDSKGMDFLNNRLEEVKKMIANRCKEQNPRYSVA